ncbi:hypothetical protein [Enterococcus sp. UD-01]|jgi:hypothetical protein|uniref:hypothetical protein n=1 Tax=Enterococcus sp. UD-01 TaxID=3373911 RepID=UPI0038334366
MDKFLARRLKVVSLLLLLGSGLFSKFSGETGKVIHMTIEVLLFGSSMYILWLIPKTDEFAGFFTMGKAKKYTLVEDVSTLLILIFLFLFLILF